VKPAGNTEVGSGTFQSQFKVISFSPQSFYSFFLTVMSSLSTRFSIPSCGRLTTVSIKWDYYGERQKEKHLLLLFPESVYKLFF
jgi:hypothetical protein